jgi:hypothetical protein
MLYDINHDVCFVYLIGMDLLSGSTSTVDLCKASYISFAMRMLQMPARKHEDLHEVSSELVMNLAEEVTHAATMAITATIPDPRGPHNIR